jgi:hypothetical protein
MSLKLCLICLILSNYLLLILKTTTLPVHTNHIYTNTFLWPTAAEIYKRHSRQKLLWVGSMNQVDIIQYLHSISKALSQSIIASNEAVITYTTNMKYFSINYVTGTAVLILWNISFLVPVMSDKYYHHTTLEAYVTEKFLPTCLTTQTVLHITINIHTSNYDWGIKLSAAWGTFLQEDTLTSRSSDTELLFTKQIL